MLINASGGLIVLGLFLRRWGVAHCSSTFETLVREFFSRSPRTGGGIWLCIRRLLRCWLSDGYYDSSPLESTLKELFGEHQRLFGHMPSGNTTKVAVTATAISDAVPVVLSNYNGSGARQPDCGE